MVGGLSQHRDFTYRPNVPIFNQIESIRNLSEKACLRQVLV
jgi:hypothetical protein